MMEISFPKYSSFELQEVEMEGGRREEERLYRQLHLGHRQALDPVVAVREIRPSMSILALTKYDLIRLVTKW